MKEQLNLFANMALKLNLKRPLAFFDLESTGVDFAKDRIVEISILRFNPDGNKINKTWRLNPTIPIPIEASQVHGIYDEDVITRPTFKDTASEIFDMLDPCDLAGFNSNRFDVPLLAEEFLLAGHEFDLRDRKMIDV